MFNYISNSREHQDFFVLSVLDKKRNGTYLEIGAGGYRGANNTYLLEKEFDWTGISLDIREVEIAKFKQYRSNPYVCTDATTVNYIELLEEYGLPKHIDFLQLDIDPPANTFKALQRIPFDKYSFSVITFEHDAYYAGDIIREESRSMFSSLGYSRIFSDVMHDKHKFEDWYINKEYMPNETWKEFIDSEVPMNPGKLPEKYVDIFKRL